MGLDAARSQDIVLASYEGLANVVEHAYPTDHRPGTLDIEVGFSPDTAALEVTISDNGQWRPTDPQPDAIRGPRFAVDLRSRRRRKHQHSPHRNDRTDALEHRLSPF
jgi:anti-sigma regulatory factor (Ser/Thr protein kinase)